MKGHSCLSLHIFIIYFLCFLLYDSVHCLIIVISLSHSQVCAENLESAINKVTYYALLYSYLNPLILRLIDR